MKMGEHCGESWLSDHLVGCTGRKRKRKHSERTEDIQRSKDRDNNSESISVGKEFKWE